MQKTIVLILTLCLFSLDGNAVSGHEPLPSWNNTPSKHAIMTFVEEITNPDTTTYVPPEERIAVFDNDGTLWSEQPLYFQLTFALDRIHALAPTHPEWKNQQPFKAALENDMKGLAASGMKGLLQLLMASHAGMTTGEFKQTVQEWIGTAKHPRFDRPYTDLVYQPMLELLAYLRANDFKTYIVSAGGRDFMRPWTEEIYGIPPEQVIGSSIKTTFEFRDGQPVIVRLPEMDFINDKEAKPVAIQQIIGRRPLAAFGNSDGDLQMLQWTSASQGARFMLLVHHTDANREWAYDRSSKIGALDKALDMAGKHGWTVVDMKKDWRVIYPFEREKEK